jgi:hypothetical protein
MGMKRNVASLLVEKPEEKGPQGRPTSKWVENIKMDLVEMS